MAETLTPRFGLRQWGSPSDTVSRGEFNEAFQNIEDRGAIDVQGTMAARPAAGIRGRYYHATDTKMTYRDTGAVWDLVGNNTVGGTATAPNVSSPAASFRSVAGQSADVLRIQSNTGAVQSSFNKFGGFKSGGVYIASNSNETIADRFNDAALSVESLETGRPALTVRGRSGQTADVFEVESSTGGYLFRVGANATVYSYRFQRSVDADPVYDAELVTWGALKRNTPDWNIRNLTQAQYNALSVKDANTLYVIT